MNRKRRKDETYEEYKQNLKNEAKALKKYLRGKCIWNFGTYRRDIHGRIGHTDTDIRNT